jgi:hypothetical protein
LRRCLMSNWDEEMFMVSGLIAFAGFCITAFLLLA